MDHIAFQQGIINKGLVFGGQNIPDSWSSNAVDELAIFDIRDYVSFGIDEGEVNVINRWPGTLYDLIMTQSSYVSWEVELLFVQLPFLIKDTEFFAIGMRIQVPEDFSDTNNKWGVFRILNMIESSDEIKIENALGVLLEYEQEIQGEDGPLAELLYEAIGEHKSSNNTFSKSHTRTEIFTDEIDGLREKRIMQLGFKESSFKTIPDEKEHGKGRYTWADGRKYEGEWKEGEIHGKGIYTWADGSQYEGEFRNGTLKGKGIYSWADGRKYEGEWKDGNHHGKGIYTWADGRKYKGEWKDGNRHGKGGLIFTSGSIYEGEWKEDKATGKGKYLSTDGAIYKGAWKDGKKHGKGELIFTDGSIYEGEWKEDIKHGKGKFTWTNGSIYEGLYENEERVEGTIKHGTLEITGQIKTIDNRTAENSYKEDVELIVNDKDGNKTKFKYGSEIKGLKLIK